METRTALRFLRRQILAAYTIGFLLGTAGLHLMGVFLGQCTNRQRWTAAALKLGGMFTAALGLGLLTR
jgi:hydrogenase/urease accessory protein HupE